MFEVIDDDGEVRTCVADFVQRRADQLVVLYKGVEVALQISRIRDWCVVDESEDDLPLSDRNRFAA